jgi:hypothetical protein
VLYEVDVGTVSVMHVGTVLTAPSRERDHERR